MEVEQQGSTSFFKTLINGVNTILGNGILITPYALASGGWVSLVLFFIVYGAATYTSLLIKRCIEVDSRIKSYIDMGKYSYGNMGKILLSIISYADLYMVTTGFLILEGDNLHNLFPHLALKIPGFVSIDGKSSFIIIVALLLAPVVLLDNLSIIAYVSTTGVLASLLILGSVVWLEVDGIGNRNNEAILNWKGLPTAISIYMLCYGSHPVFPTLYTSMLNKRHFSKVLFICFTFSTLVYVSMATLGYSMFGSKVESQITLNLPTRKIGSQIAIYTTLITPLAKYALLLKPIVMTTEGWFSTNLQRKLWFKVIIRLVLVATQVVIAAILPFFGYLSSLSGALLCALASLTIPCICYLKISSTGVNSSPRLPERFLIWVIVLFSILILVFGTYTSVKDILSAKLTA